MQCPHTDSLRFKIARTSGAPQRLHATVARLLGFVAASRAPGQPAWAALFCATFI
jgi:hypothetical protein